jgi:hypothetical protein
MGAFVGRSGRTYSRGICGGSLPSRSFLRPRRLAPARTPSVRCHQILARSNEVKGRGRTRWIGDDGIEEPATSPGVAGDVERTEVYDPLRNPVLSSRADDTRGFSFRKTVCQDMESV